jgi:hypothetical protein
MRFLAHALMARLGTPISTEIPAFSLGLRPNCLVGRLDVFPCGKLRPVFPPRGLDWAETHVCLGRETIPVPSERRVSAPPPPLPSERATGYARLPPPPQPLSPSLCLSPLIRSYPRRAHGESPLLRPAPSVERPIVRIGLRGRALVSRDSRAGLACSLQRLVDREVRVWYGSAWSQFPSARIAMLLVQPDYRLMGFPWCLDERGEKLP